MLPDSGDYLKSLTVLSSMMLRRLAAGNSGILLTCTGGAGVDDG